MAYTLHHRPVAGLGIEANVAVVETWNRICNLSESEILSYKLPNVGEVTDDHWLIQAAFSEHASTAIKRVWTKRMNRDAEPQKRYAAKHVDYAREHIRYLQGHYLDAPDVEATWFIDPPYQKVVKGYLRDDLDYAQLREFCLSRKGQVVVCEQQGADWLPFHRLYDMKGTVNRETTEMVWTND